MQVIVIHQNIERKLQYVYNNITRNEREETKNFIFHLFIPNHPVNLSISFTGGKEIKRDIHSNGE